MKIIIHNLLRGSSKEFEGDAKTIERELEKEYPWAVRVAQGDLNFILAEIDRHPYLGVEVADKTPHPFLRG